MKPSVVVLLTSLVASNISLYLPWISVAVAQTSYDIADQCERLILEVERMGPRLGAIQPPESVTGLIEMLESLYSVSTRASFAMSVLRFDDPQVQQFQQRFVDQYDQFSQIVQDFLSAIRTEDTNAEQAAMERAGLLGEEEYDLTADVNRFCSRFGDDLIYISRSVQCNQLIGIANRAVSQVQAITSTASPEDITAMEAIAVVADQAISEMGSLYLADPQLQHFQQRFLQMYVDTSRSTRALIVAVEQVNAAAADAAYEDIKAATDLEAPLVGEVNRYCSSVEVEEDG